MIDFDLDKFYAAILLPEEEYCTVFVVVSKVMDLMRKDMKEKAKKLSNKIKQEFPLAASLVRGHIGKKGVKNNSESSGNRNITHQEVKTVKDWIRQALEG